MFVAVYYWQGEMTSSDVRAACALQAFRKEHEVSNHGRRSGLFPVLPLIYQLVSPAGPLKDVSSEWSRAESPHTSSGCLAGPSEDIRQSAEEDMGLHVTLM